MNDYRLSAVIYFKKYANVSESAEKLCRSQPLGLGLYLTEFALCNDDSPFAGACVSYISAYALYGIVRTSEEAPR